MIVSLHCRVLIANFSLWERFVVPFFFDNFISFFLALFLKQSIYRSKVKLPPSGVSMHILSVTLLGKWAFVSLIGLLVVGPSVVAVL